MKGAAPCSTSTSSATGEDHYPPLGAKLRGFHDLESDRRQGLVSLLTAVLGLCVMIGFLHAIIVLIAFSWSPFALAVLAALVPLVFVQAPLAWSPLIHGYMMQTWREYFRATFLTEYDFSRSNKNYLIAAYPHGAFPIGPILSARYMPALFPRCRTVVLAASVLFRIPVARQFFRALGALPATRANLVHALSDHKNVGICVGGIAEMFMLHPQREQIVLKKRRGFIAAALCTGTDIVPSYHFGNSVVTSFGPAWLQTVSRRLRASLGLVTGMFGLPIPHPKPLHVVYGPPVQVGEPMSTDDPRFHERCEQIHTEFTESLVALYERHKAKYGWADRELVVC